MIIREVFDQEKVRFNSVANHPLQTWQWGDFKKETGVEVVRLGSFEGDRMIRSFQLTIHKIPKLNWNIGYFPRSAPIDEQLMFAAATIAKKHNLVFVKIEPNVYQPAASAKDNLAEARQYLLDKGCVMGRAQFTPYSFILDIRPDLDTLTANFKPKTRYNIRLAGKAGVTVVEDNSSAGFDDYLKLWRQTTKRQKFYAHDEAYQVQMWNQMHQAGTARLLKAVYQGQVLGVWILFVHNQVLYYPYGASSREYREVMANNLLAYEAIKLGQRLKCHTFDMWGCLGPEADPKDPWYGFHRFKAGYGPTLSEFVGSFDYVHDPQRYQIYKLLDTWRWRYLRLRSKLPF